MYDHVLIYPTLANEGDDTYSDDDHVIDDYDVHPRRAARAEAYSAIMRNLDAVDDNDHDILDLRTARNDNDGVRAAVSARHAHLDEDEMQELAADPDAALDEEPDDGSFAEPDAGVNHHFEGFQVTGANAQNHLAPQGP